MKRYLLFACANFYPGGGKHDVAGDFDSLEEIKSHIDLNDVPSEYHILDMEERKWIDFDGKEVENNIN
jgi:hypothetical protein